MKSRIQKAIEKRRDLFHAGETNCFRLLNLEGDNIPFITADLYGEYLLIQHFNEESREQVPVLAECLQEELEKVPVAVKGVLSKDRAKACADTDHAERRKSRLVEGRYPPDGFTVFQNGVLVAVDLVSGQSTGLFLDMREVRDFLADIYSEGDTLLNLFCYTAVFSVHALKNGVRHAINVDLSKAVLEKARVNYGINGLKTDDRDFVYGDAGRWIRSFVKKERAFSFVILDPPTFSRNKKSSFTVKNNYREMLGKINSLAREGHVLSSVNSRSVSYEEYLSFHPGGWKVEHFFNEPPDFPFTERPYLKVGLWRTG